ncbi:MAG: hypothetical protein GC181_06775 [Bacteroidetes bacterium]|nr:hypothetical protein [Bacteroidota bacterium]
MDFIGIFSDINYSSFVLVFVKWILLALAVSILILILCYKSGFFKRNTKTARYLVKAYFILIPVYFIVFAIKYAPVRNLQYEINHSIDKHKQAITNYASDVAGRMISDSLVMQQSSAQDMVNYFLASVPKSADSDSQNGTKNFFHKYLISIEQNLKFRFLVRIAEKVLVSNASEYLGLHKETGKSLYQTKLHDLIKKGQIVEIFKKELNTYFSHYYRILFILFLLGLLIPVTEIILSRIFRY